MVFPHRNGRLTLFERLQLMKRTFWSASRSTFSSSSGIFNSSKTVSYPGGVMWSPFVMTQPLPSPCWISRSVKCAGPYFTLEVKLRKCSKKRNQCMRVQPYCHILLLQIGSLDKGTRTKHSKQFCTIIQCVAPDRTCRLVVCHECLIRVFEAGLGSPVKSN